MRSASGLPMTGVVNFKFKSALAYDSVKFDGAFISVTELKGLIAEKKGLGSTAGNELLLSDPRTKAEYTDEAQLIPKNSSVVVRRTPAGRQQPTLVPADPLAAVSAGPPRPQGPYQTDELGGDLYSQPASRARPEGAEDEALQAALDKTQEEWAAGGRGGRGFGRGRGRGRGGIREAPPPHYRCHRCHEPGHWIENCPTLDDPDFRPKLRPTGIPTSMMRAAEDGSLLLANGTTATLQPNEAGFQREMAALSGKQPDAHAANTPPAVVGSGTAAPLPPVSAATTAPPTSLPLLDNKPHQPPPLSKPSASLALATEGPVLAGDTAPQLPESTALALPGLRLPPLPFPIGQGGSRPLLPPSLAAPATTTEPPTPVTRAPADFVLQAFDPERAGPMGREEFALLQAAMRKRDAGHSHRCDHF